MNNTRGNGKKERELNLIYVCIHLSGTLMEKLQRNINLFRSSTGDCDFERPLSACGYSQGRDDDLDWEQANTREKPSSDPWMPSGKSTGAGSIATSLPHED